MNYREQAVRIRCGQCWLYGILSLPDAPCSRGVLIAVGGPQYRIGSHRQFVLLARELAQRNIACLRFDFRGMGDSEGDMRSFEEVDEDIASAVNFFLMECAFLRDVVIWGLCDAASAALFYAHKDTRISGLVLLNPWVRTEEGIARTYLRHHYLTRPFEAEFWKKLISGQFDATASVRSLYTTIKSLAQARNSAPISENINLPCGEQPLPDRMLDGLTHFHGKVLVITSGKDMTAREFLDLTGASSDWQASFRTRQVKFSHLAAANHTFSTRQWRDQVAELTGDWLRSW
ncbi:MAG: hydrolase 1, exosortase A system-associated [Nitrosomonas sp.]|nr:hydrolase 1, exosortase A system-associated [Nitrosomonas sp.]